jgi:DNA-binding LacI/PurR family transcriptional regulator
VYNCKIWEGISDVAKEQDANVIAFSGGPLHDPNGFGIQHNIVYDLVNVDMLDGLILLGGAISTYLSSDEKQAFYHRYTSKPLICVGEHSQEFPSIVLNNTTGLRMILEHLIVEHGYRRIGFITGGANIDAQERYQVYTDVLTSYDIPVNPEFIAPGDLMVESGFNAIRLFFDERQADVEAIVAVNDYTAWGAIQALQQRGLRVPDDVAVTGFDNIDIGWYSVPPLTTVEQPTYEIGRKAAEMLLAKLQGKQLVDEMVIPTRAVLRQSCGCLSQTVQQARVPYPDTVGRNQPLEKTSRVLLIASHHSQILSEMMSLFAKAYPEDLLADLSEKSRKLLNSFFQGLRDGETDRFITLFANILRELIILGYDISIWQDIIASLRHEVLPNLLDPARMVQAENLCQQAQILLDETILQAQIYSHLKANQQAQRLRNIGQTFVTTFDVNQLMELMKLNISHHV